MFSSCVNSSLIYLDFRDSYTEKRMRLHMYEFVKKIRTGTSKPRQWEHGEEGP